jgi:Family of unknown function (DUF5989)
MRKPRGAGAVRSHDQLDRMMSKLAVLREFWSFLRVRKKWWLAPIVVFLLLLGFVLVFAESSALAPFIYSLF